MKEIIEIPDDILLTLKMAPKGGYDGKKTSITYSDYIKGIDAREYVRKERNSWD